MRAGLVGHRGGMRFWRFCEGKGVVFAHHRVIRVIAWAKLAAKASASAAVLGCTIAVTKIAVQMRCQCYRTTDCLA